MTLFKVTLFLFGVLLLVMGMPTIGGACVFAVALNEFCDEFGNGRQRR